MPSYIIFFFMCSVLKSKSLWIEVTYKNRYISWKEYPTYEGPHTMSYIHWRRRPLLRKYTIHREPLITEFILASWLISLEKYLLNLDKNQWNSHLYHICMIIITIYKMAYKIPMIRFWRDMNHSDVTLSKWVVRRHLRKIRKSGRSRIWLNFFSFESFYSAAFTRWLVF